MGYVIEKGARSFVGMKQKKQRTNRFMENNEIKELVSVNVHGKQLTVHYFPEYSRKINLSFTRGAFH